MQDVDLITINKVVDHLPCPQNSWGCQKNRKAFNPLFVPINHQVKYSMLWQPQLKMSALNSFCSGLGITEVYQECLGQFPRKAVGSFFGSTFGRFLFGSNLSNEELDLGLGELLECMGAGQVSFKRADQICLKKVSLKMNLILFFISG